MAAEALIGALGHPSELWSLINFQFLGGKKQLFPPNDVSECTASMQKCYTFLNLTSRSFAAVIQALDPELRPAISLFYLILRGLDTVEDDMTIPTEEKNAVLRNFYQHITERGWTFDGNGPDEKDRRLLVEFDCVVDEYLALKPKYQSVIADITKRMGEGMAIFQEKTGGVETIDEYNLYCHYVAGLVGLGLSGLFGASGLEDPVIATDDQRANNMGLFLQKTNIIRDYLEDLNDGRTWYPREIWGKHSADLADFKDPKNRKQALACLNEMVADALTLIPDVFVYMSRLRNQSVFNFCAIPQVMAIATLAMCYNNGGVFEGVVKIRKGTAVSLMIEATTMPAIYRIFERYCMVIVAKMPPQDPSAVRTQQTLDTVRVLIKQAQEQEQQRSQVQEVQPLSQNIPLRMAMLVTGVAALWFAAKW